MASSPAEGLSRLRAAAESGELDAFCRKHHVRILTVFGSTARGEPTARDLDIGIMTEPDADFDIFTAVYELMVLTDVDRVDVAHLNRGGPSSANALWSDRSCCTNGRRGCSRRPKWRPSPNGWRPTASVG